jgi:menaquinone-dependent protoporphyrinogen oxidase
MAKVLIAYASKYGSTKEIAEKVGAVIKGEGLDTDILSADKVMDISAYKDIIIGAAMYIGMWRKEAKNFVTKYEKALAEKRVWVFSSGPSGKGDPAQLLKGVVVPAGIKLILDRIKPQDIVVFHGNLNVNKMGGLEKFMVKRVGGDTGDYRDWEMITAWARKTAAAIKK